MARPSETHVAKIHVGKGAAFWYGTPNPLTADDLEFADDQLRPTTGTFLGLTTGDCTISVRYTIERNQIEGNMAPRASDLKRIALDAEISGVAVTFSGSEGETLRQKLLCSASNIISQASSNHTCFTLTLIAPNELTETNEGGEAFICSFYAVYSEQAVLQLPAGQAAKQPMTFKAVLPDTGDNLGTWFNHEYTV